MIKESIVKHIPGHKNSKGEGAPWVIVDHDDGKVLSSHKSETEAKKRLRAMKVYSKTINLHNISNIIELIREAADVETTGYIDPAFDEVLDKIMHGEPLEEVLEKELEEEDVLNVSLEDLGLVEEVEVRKEKEKEQIGLEQYQGLGFGIDDVKYLIDQLGYDYSQLSKYLGVSRKDLQQLYKGDAPRQKNIRIKDLLESTPQDIIEYLGSKKEELEEREKEKEQFAGSLRTEYEVYADDILKLLDEGMSQEEIANYYGLKSRKTIYNLLRAEQEYQLGERKYKPFARGLREHRGTGVDDWVQFMTEDQVTEIFNFVDSLHPLVEEQIRKFMETYMPSKLHTAKDPFKLFISQIRKLADTLAIRWKLKGVGKESFKLINRLKRAKTIEDVIKIAIDLNIV